MTQSADIPAVITAPHFSGPPIPTSAAIMPHTLGFAPVGAGLAIAPGINISSLYVGELKPDVSEQLLWSTFAPYGQVLSVKVCRDSHTGASLGYGYVNYRTHAEAEKAMDAVNFSSIDGKPCRVMWSMRDSTRRKFGIANLFIKNIDPNLDAKSLYQAFSSFGSVLSCKIALDQYGLSKGYGFIQFLNEQDAELARQRSNGVAFSNKVLVVNKFISKADRKDAKTVNPDEYTNIYVKNFSKDWSEDDLRKRFEKYGDITSLFLRRNENKESMGFGFINFAKHEGALAAVNAENGHVFDNGDVLTVTRAMKIRERKAFLRRQYEERKRENFKKTEKMNLYIKNFDENVTDTKLQELFQEFGEIKSAHVMKDESERSRCFGFVCFTNPEDAQKAIDAMHLKVIEGRPLYVAHAQSKEDRRKTFEQQSINNSFRGPLLGPPGGVQFVYPAAGGYPFNPNGQFPRFQPSQGQNRNQQRNQQQGNNQPGQQYVSGMQRNYNYQQGGSYQGTYRPRNNAGGMSRSNQGSYQQRQYQSQPQIQQPVQVSVNQVTTENVNRPKKEEHKTQQPKQQPDLRSEFNDKLFALCKDLFKLKGFNDEHLYRATAVVMDYIDGHSISYKDTNDPDLMTGLENAYNSIVTGNPLESLF